MNIIKSLVTLILIGVAAFSALSQERKDEGRQSQASVIDREINGGLRAPSKRLRDVIPAALASSGVPGGVVLFEDESDYDYEFGPDSLPLRDFLDSIVIARPRYRWVEEDGVIDFVPTTGLPELLGARVSEFEANKVTRGEALDALKGSPEVKDIINRRGMDEFTLSLCCGLSNPNPPPPKRFSIKYKNATVKEILNAIAREHGQAVWFYMEWQDWPERGKRYYQLYIH